MGKRIRNAGMALALSAAICAGVAAQRAPAVSLGPASAVFAVPDDLFTAITSVRELTDGRVLVADLMEKRVALIDFDRGASTPVGRIGNGPGEYRGVGWLFPLAGDSTILTDNLARRWIVLDGTEPIRTIPASDPLARSLGPGLLGTDQLGHVLGTVPLLGSTPLPRVRENADTLGLVLASRSGLALDTIALIRGRGPGGLCVYVAGRPGRPIGPPCNRLASEDLALLFPDGWIAVASAGPYHVDWRAPGGEWIHGQDIPRDPVPVDEEVKCAIFGKVPSGIGLGRSCDFGRYVWPSVMPPFLSQPPATTRARFSPALLTTPDGELLIRRASVSRRDSVHYDLVDRRGALVGVLALASNQTVVGFGVESVYIAETEESGLQALRRHRWP